MSDPNYPVADGDNPVAERDMVTTLQSSVYPGASRESVEMVLSWCRAQGIDPFARAVHIVPMYDKATKRMRDVVMEGVNSYRIKASRSPDYRGISAPTFGPMQTHDLDGVRIEAPEWCEVTVQRRLGDDLVDFTAREYWLENYATAKRDSRAPNAMWSKRPRGQLAKCAEAQALRRAYPELAGATTADETMIEVEPEPPRDVTPPPTSKADQMREKLAPPEPEPVEVVDTPADDQSDMLADVPVDDDTQKASFGRAAEMIALAETLAEIDEFELKLRAPATRSFYSDAQFATLEAALADRRKDLQAERADELAT